MSKCTSAANEQVAQSLARAASAACPPVKSGPMIVPAYVTVCGGSLSQGPLVTALQKHFETYSGLTETRPCDELAAVALSKDDL